MFAGLGLLGGLGLGPKSGTIVVAVPALLLSPDTIAEDAIVGAIVGGLSVTNLGVRTVSSYTITADPSSKFDIANTDLVLEATVSDGTYSVTVRATLSDASTVDGTFSIIVTDVVTISAPVIAAGSAPDDTTPDIDVDLPVESTAGDTLRIQVSATGAGVWSTYVVYVLTAQDIIDDEIIFFGVTELSEATYDFRSRVERGAVIGDWSNTLTRTISASDPLPGSVASVVGFGDSIVFGQDASDAAHKWLNIVATALSAGTPLNKGTSGTVLQNSNDITAAPRANNGRDRYAADITGSNKRDLLFIAYGYNDARYSGAPATFNVAAYENDYTEIIADLIATRGYTADQICIVSPYYVLDTSLAHIDSGYNGTTRAAYLEYVAAAEAVALAFGTYYHNSYAYMLANGGDSLFNGLHPEDAGHAVIAAGVLTATRIAVVLAPSQFGTSDWSIADKADGTGATITITALPQTNGGAITALQFQVDGGSWTSLGGTTTGAYSAAMSVASHTVAIRAVNSGGNGVASATKPVTASLGGVLLEYLGSDIVTATQTVFNLTGAGIDSGDAGKVAVAVIAARSNGSGLAPTGVVIGGATATLVAGTTTDTTIDGSVAIWRATLGGSPTNTCVVTYGSNVTCVTAGMFVLTNANATPTDSFETKTTSAATTSDNSGAPITTPTSGVMILGCYTGTGSAGNFTGVATINEHAEVLLATGYMIVSSRSDGVAHTNETVTFTGSSFTRQIVGGTFGP